MVLEAIFDFGIWLFQFIAEFMPSAQPVIYNTANTFTDILSFGVWVIGYDMWEFIIVTIAGWLTFKLTWGVILFIYRLIPLL